MGRVAPCLHSQPFDTALRAYSGQAVDLLEATSETSIRFTEFCLVISQPHPPLGRGEIAALRGHAVGREKTPFRFPETANRKYHT